MGTKSTTKHALQQKVTHPRLLKAASSLSPPHTFQATTTPKPFTMPKEKTTRAKRSTKAEGGRKKKDPNQPKRGLSAYMFFANEQRDKVREDNPGIKFGEVGKMLGEKWKAPARSRRSRTRLRPRPTSSA